jgi:peptidyl-prolyl cis-trans isomerase C
MVIKKSFHKWRLIIGVALCAFCVFLPLDVRSSQNDGIVAQVNGIVITEGELQSAVSSYIPLGMFHGQLEDKREKYRKEALEGLINKELIYQEALKKNVVADKKEVEEHISTKRSKFRSESEFKRALDQAGLSIDLYTKIIKRDLAVKKFEREVLEKVSGYSDEEIRAYYEKNIDRFKSPESYRVSHILINVPPNALQKERDEKRKRADDLFNRLKPGEDFASVAHESSEDQYRVKGGDLGWVHTGRLFPEVEKALKSMKVGDMRVVESLYGFHIVLLRDKRPPRTKELDEVKEQLRSKLEKKRLEEKKAELIKKLKEKADIKVMDDRR